MLPMSMVMAKEKTKTIQTKTIKLQLFLLCNLLVQTQGDASHRIFSKCADLFSDLCTSCFHQAITYLITNVTNMARTMWYENGSVL